MSVPTATNSRDASRHVHSMSHHENPFWALCGTVRRRLVSGTNSVRMAVDITPPLEYHDCGLSHRLSPHLQRITLRICGVVYFVQLYRAVFQHGIFMRALRPARTVLRPARLSSALPELLGKKIIIN